VFEVDVHPPGEAIGDDERRAGEVVRTNLRVDASLEVAVPRKDARGPEILGVDRTFDRLGKRAGVPDTGRTAVADDVVAEVFEVREKPRRFEIFGDDAASGRETRLDVRGDVEPALDSVTSEEAPPRSSRTDSTCSYNW